MRDDITFVCITPVRDEAWILPVFLDMNSQWADYMIILDQCSTDESAKIAKAHPKVIYIKNENTDFNEEYRQHRLYEEARKIKAKKRIIIALDADEYIPPSLLRTEEWKSLPQLILGTRIYMRWIQILPDKKHYYEVGDLRPFGYIDDSAPINGKKIHNERVPINKTVKPYYCQTVVNIHLGYTPVIRNYKKHSWYLMWEYQNKDLTAFDLNYNYRKLVGQKNKTVRPIIEKWLPDVVKNKNLDITEQTVTWWDKDIINWFTQNGVKKFKKIDIWRYDWNIISDQISPSFQITDPRSRIDKLIVDYISYAKYHKNILTRVMNYILKSIWG